MQELVAALVVIGAGLVLARYVHRGVVVDAKIVPSIQARLNLERLEEQAKLSTAFHPGVRRALVLGVITQESEGFELATGSSGEVGLMQLTQGVLSDYERVEGRRFTKEDAFIARVNVAVGSWYLARQVEQFGNEFDGLRAYNCGPTGARVNKKCGVQYAKRVLGYAAWYGENQAT